MTWRFLHYPHVEVLPGRLELVIHSYVICTCKLLRVEEVITLDFEHNKVKARVLVSCKGT